MTFLVDSNGALVTVSGGGLASSLGAGMGGNIHQFTLTNTNGSGTSNGFSRIGLAFEKDNVPAGRILQAEINSSTIRSSMLNINTWSDGSLRSCILCVDAGSFTAGQSKTIDVKAVAGTQSTSGLDAVSFITGLTDDLTVEIRNHTGSDNNTNVGNLDFSLKTAIATATRREITDDTDLVVRLWCWQQVSPDEHLICLHYVDLWLNSGGSVVAYEWTPVMSQHWWVDDPFGTAMTKQLRNYDATIKQGSTTLESHTGLAHAYYCRWAGLRTDDDDQHAKRLWFDHSSTAMPTLSPAYSTDSRKRMMRAGYLTPVDLSEAYSTDIYSDPTSTQNGGIQDDHTPLGTNGHKAAVNAVGGYVGRGIMGDVEGKAITVQTTARWRQNRVMAQAALSISHHIRDHRTVSSDASGKIIPSKVNPLGAKSYAGLAAETIAVSGSGAELADDQPVGGQGSFSAWDFAHHTSYGYLAAFVEGEQYLSDAVLSQFDFQLHGLQGSGGYARAFNGSGSNPSALWEEDGRTGLPTATYGSIYLGHRQERELAWTQVAFDHAFALLADDAPEKPLLENLRTNAANWLQDSIDEFPAAQVTHGSMWTRNPPEAKHWQQNFVAMAFARAAILSGGLQGFASTRDQAFGWAKSLIDEGRMYASEVDTYLRHTESGPGFEGYLAAADIYPIMKCTGISSNTLTFTHRSEMVLTDDDTAIPLDSGTDGGDAVPSELTAGTVYHVINATRVSATQSTCQLSTTQGGAAITFADTTTDATFGVKRAVDLTAVMGTGGTYIASDDDFATIFSATAEYMWGIRSSLIDQDGIDAVRAWVAPAFSGGATFSSWRLNGDNMR